MTLGGGVVVEKTRRPHRTFSKTASPPKKHNASLWRLNVADCVCWRIWKEEGGEAGRMWCLKSTWLWFFFKKKLIIVVDTARQKMHRWCDVSVWFYVEGWQKPVSRGDGVLPCVWGLANTHTLEHLSPAKTDNTLFNLSVMHHVMSVSVLLLAAGCCCLCVRVTLAVFAQLSTSACPLSGAFLLLSGSSFQDGQWVSWQDPPPPVPIGRQWEVCRRGMK